MEETRSPDPARGIPVTRPSQPNASPVPSTAAPQMAMAPPMPPLPAAPVVPGYEVLGQLGRGGMGVVYKARQIQVGRVVALKMILAGGHASEADVARFLGEAEAVARLQHGNIVQLFEAGRHESLPWFSLEFCPGGSLADTLRGGPLLPRDAARLVAQIAHGVEHAHQKGIVHRDLKPHNVLLAEDGTPKVADFGLARRVEVGSGLTATGAVLGTPSYMAPEQASGEGKRVGPAADVYGLGAILYECLTGQPPFHGPTPLDTMMQVVTREPVPVRRLRPEVPVDLETISRKCLEKDAKQRYASAAALADDLHRYLEGGPIKARPLGWVECGGRWLKRNGRVAAMSTVILLLLVAVGLLAYFASRHSGPLFPPPTEGIKGRLLPLHRRWVYSPTDARVVRFEVTPGQTVTEGRTLVVLADAQLSKELLELETTTKSADAEARRLQAQLTAVVPPSEKGELLAKLSRAEREREVAKRQLHALLRNFHVRFDQPGQFALIAQGLPLPEGPGGPKPEWKVINGEFRERLTNQIVKRSDPLLRLAVQDGPWQVELKIPQRHLGRVLDSLGRDKAESLDVDFWFPADPSHTYRGRLDRGRIASETVVEQGEDGSEPVVEAIVRLDGPDIPESARIPRELLVVDQEVAARINSRGEESEASARTPLALPDQGHAITRTGIIRVHPEASFEVLVDRENVLLSRLHVRDGQEVRSGDQLAEFRSPDLEQQLAQSEALLDAYAKQLRDLNQLAVDIPDAQQRARIDSEIVQARAKREQAAAETDRCKERLPSLVLRAQRSGTVLSPPSQEQVGRAWAEHQLFCRIADLSRQQVLLPLPRPDHDRLKNALHGATPAALLRAAVRPEGLAGPVCEGQVREASLAKLPAKEIPEQLSERIGGPVAVLPSARPGETVPRDEVYLLEIDLKDPGCLTRPGLRAQVTIPLSLDR